MTKLDLITGFLGSGKTTFLKMYAKYLINSGENIAILENDYGAVNVDMMLLDELQGDKCELEMVSASCHMDCHKRRFKTKLISMGMCGYDRVIVEPSGVFDVDEFFDICREDPINRMYEINNVIAIVDSRLSSDMTDESDFYLASYIANCGQILLSRTQLCDKEQIEATKAHLTKAAKLVKLTRDFAPIISEKDWYTFDNNDFESIKNCGYEINSYEKIIAGQNSTFSSVYFLELSPSLESVKKILPTLFTDTSLGNIFRLKGFIKENDQWFQINATSRDLDIEPIHNGQDVIIIIGEHINRKEIENLIGENAIGKSY